MLYLSGISITFFLVLLLLSKKNKSLADNVLACWLLVIGFHLLNFYLFISGRHYEYPALLGVAMPVPLLHGPFLFLYVATLTRQIPAFRKKDALHFVPAIIAYIYLIRFFLLPAEQKIYIFQNRGVGYEVFQTVNISAIIVSGIVYVAWSIIRLNRHKRSILDQFSYTEKITLDWLHYLIYGIAFIWIFVIVGNETMVFGSAVLFVLFIGYFGIRQVGIFTSPPVFMHPETAPPNHTRAMWVASDSETEDDAAEGNELKRKYSRSGLTEESAEGLHKKLSWLMANEKPYTDSELTLTDLARRLNTVPNYLSQVINEKEEKNFYDYINTLRIEEFKKLAADPANQQFTLLSLAYDCGFNSKSSFNKYFRKVTGESPSGYLKQPDRA